MCSRTSRTQTDAGSFHSGCWINSLSAPLNSECAIVGTTSVPAANMAADWKDESTLTGFTRVQAVLGVRVVSSLRSMRVCIHGLCGLGERSNCMLVLSVRTSYCGSPQAQRLQRICCCRAWGTSRCTTTTLLSIRIWDRTTHCVWTNWAALGASIERLEHPLIWYPDMVCQSRVCGRTAS